MTPHTGLRIVRRGEWQDWERSCLLDRYTQACLDRALECSLESWAQALALHREDLRRAQQASLQEVAALRQESHTLGYQEGLSQWLEHLMVWTHYRRSRMSTLREDMAQLLSAVLSQVLSAVPPRQWLAEVLARLDPLVDGQHTLIIHVSNDERDVLEQAVDQWWKTSGWCGAAPQVLGNGTLVAGQCRMVSAAGEVSVDMPGLIKALEQCVLSLGHEEGRGNASSTP